MLPIIPKPAITRRQKSAAILVAGFADFLQLMVFPLFSEGFLSPFDDALDFVVALALIAICGFRWQFILAFMLELVPGLDLLPTWTAVALTLPVQSARQNTVHPDLHQASQYPPIHVSAVAVEPKNAPESH